MKDTISTLPESWAPATIGEICTALQYGYTASASDEPCGPRFLRITDIQNGLVQWSSVPYCQIESELTQKYQLHPGDIVFARTGGTVGKSFIISFIPEPSVFASYLIRLSAHSNVEPKYLYYFFQTASYWEQIGLKKGGLQGNVNATTLSSLELPICSLNEQHRIVAKIEELFSELDKGIENLKTARAQLKVYRQALLKHAFEGKLTAQWRKEKQDKLETADALHKRIQQERAQRYQQQLADGEATGGSKPKAPKPLPPLTKEELAELPELPEGWGWVRLGELTSIIAGNAFEKAEYSDSGVRLFQIANVSFGEIVWDKIVHLPEKYWDDYSELRLFSRDLVMALNRPLLGDDLKIGRLGLADTPSILYQRVGKFVPHSDDVTNLIYWYLRSPDFIQALKKELRGVNIPFINQTRLMEYPVPLCDFDELAQLVAELESRFSVVDQLDQTIATSLQQAEALRQSILKKAFSGQLVPQDPHDEPAAVLLERIRAGIATSPNNRKCGK